MSTITTKDIGRLLRNMRGEVKVVHKYQDGLFVLVDVDTGNSEWMSEFGQHMKYFHGTVASGIAGGMEGKRFYNWIDNHQTISEIISNIPEKIRSIVVPMIRTEKVSDLIAHDIFGSTEGLAVSQVTVSYRQEADACVAGMQELVVSTNDGGGGPYYVIETNRWAFNSIEDLIKVLEDFKRRANFKEAE